MGVCMAEERRTFIGDFGSTGQVSTVVRLDKKGICDVYPEFNAGKHYRLVVSHKGGLHLEIWPYEE